MNFSTDKRHLWIFAALAAVMWTTRSDHFGSAVSLPDASLALFFMAGFYSRNLLLFLGLCSLATFSDYWAISHRGVSSFCVTAAYGFLLPAYYVMWWTGRRAASPEENPLASALSLAVLALLATTASFMISSGSFYLLAPYFAEHSWSEFAGRVALYYPRSAGYTLGYLALGFALHYAWRLALAARNEQHG